MKSVKNQSKQKYTPCELKVVEFNVERGFADSTGDSTVITPTSGNFAKTQAQVWSMLRSEGEGPNAFRNNSARYGNGNGEKNVDNWFF